MYILCYQETNSKAPKIINSLRSQCIYKIGIYSQVCTGPPEYQENILIGPLKNYDTLCENYIKVNFITYRVPDNAIFGVFSFDHIIPNMCSS